jgi:hypothetical protein
LIALFESDLHGIAAALREQTSATFQQWNWHLPVYHAAVCGPAAVAALQVLQRAGANISLAALDCKLLHVEVRDSLELKQLNASQRNLLTTMAIHRTAPELAVARGDPAVVAALLDAGACAELNDQSKDRLAKVALKSYGEAAPDRLPAAAASGTALLDILLKHGAATVEKCVAAAVHACWRRRGCSADGSQRLLRWIASHLRQTQGWFSRCIASKVLKAAFLEADTPLMLRCAKSLRGYDLVEAAEALAALAATDADPSTLRQISGFVLDCSRCPATKALRVELLRSLKSAATARMAILRGRADALQLLVEAGLEVTLKMLPAAWRRCACCWRLASLGLFKGFLW